MGIKKRRSEAFLSLCRKHQASYQAHDKQADNRGYGARKALLEVA